MSYEIRLRELFKGVELDVEDFYLLEKHQISYLPDRVPRREFAAVLHANPSIKRYLITRHPPIVEFIEDVLSRFGPAADQQELDTFSDKLIWEIADQFIYTKRPEVIDERGRHSWDLDEILSGVSLENKVVIDAGAGTGQLAIAAAQTAELVYAVEPNTSLRHFIIDKASGKEIKNLFAVDGFLHAIPLPDGFADILFTSRAIGWNLEEELQEVERVVKKGGHAIHFTGYPDAEEDSHLHPGLTKWGYSHSRYKDKEGWKRMYWKQI